MSKLPLSSYVLIAANLIPLAGVLFYDWDAILVLALFWIENLIIGGFNILRILSATFLKREWGGIFTCGFFILHYGMFCSVHGTLLSDLIGYPKVDYTDYFAAGNFGLGQIFLEAAAVFLSFVENLAPAIWLGIAALTMSRLVSFIENFILRGEIFTRRIAKLMVEPYSQILIMHVGLILGAVVLQKLNSPVWLLALIVLFKIIVDFNQHRRRHKESLADRAEVVKDL